MSTGGRGVLAGAFALLDALPEVSGPHQLRDLAARTGVPRASVYRLLAQLREVGMVELQHGRYVVGPAALALGRRVEPHPGLRAHTAEVLRGLHASTGTTVVLTGRGERGDVMLDVVPGHDRLPIDIHPGQVVPPGVASSAVHEPVATRAGGAARGRASAVDPGDVVPGITCFAVALPLPNRATAALAVISMVSTPAERFAPAVFHAAAAIDERVHRERAAAVG